MDYDIVIIGGGPAGLSFACSMMQTNAEILVVEKQSVETMAKPKPDGREIALTHLSLDILKKIGAWDLIDKEQISLLKEAKVFDGDSPSLLNFKSEASDIEALGYLVPNYQLKQALYQRAKQAKNVTIMSDFVVGDVISHTSYSEVLFANGKTLKTKLVIAADSRFSSIRRKVGIPVVMKDFSKVMIVTTMKHEKSHNNIALERFDYGQTLALLPMVGNESSVVLTVKTQDSQKILDMSAEDFNIKMTQDFKQEVGQMKQVGERHSYPLVGVHAQTFIAKRFALIGDASVGMHPLTAHGFNLGLRGQDVLASLVKTALLKNQDIGEKTLLEQFEKQHIYLTKIMFFGTNGVVELFTNDAPVFKQIRKFVLGFSEHFPPIKSLITNHLTEVKKPMFPMLKRVFNNN